MDTTADRLLSNLSSALKPEGNNARVAEALAGDLDVARSTAAAIDTVRNPDLTTGQTLDYVAKMFNVARTVGESDDRLRSRIMTQIKQHYSCGTLSDIRGVIEHFTGLSGSRVQIREPPDVHIGWGYGEGRYGVLPWGTPHAMFRVEVGEERVLIPLPGSGPLSPIPGMDPLPKIPPIAPQYIPVFVPGLMAAIDLVRAAGVYVQDLVVCSTLQGVLAAAEGSTLWIVPAPLRSGFGAEGYGAGEYGYCAYAVRATAEGAVDLQVNAEAAVVAGIRHGLEPGRSPYGWAGFGGRVDAATIEYDILGEAAVEASAETDLQVLVETPLGYGTGRLGTEPYGSPAGTVRVSAGSTIILQMDTEVAVLAGIQHGLEPGRSPYGWAGFGGRIDAATIEYDILGEAAVEASAETDPLQVLVETVLGYGAGRLGTEPYGTRAGSVDARAESAVDLVIEPTAAVTAQAASYLGYAGWMYGQYEFGF